MELAIIAVVAIALAVILAGVFSKASSQAGLYKARSLMTENEAEFFGRLVAALPDHYVFPQIAMSALIEPATGNRKTAHSDRLRIAQQRVDYAVYDRNYKCIAVIELDDRTHSAAKDQVRDARLQQAGLRTVRFQSKNKPSVDALRAAILPAPAGPDISQPVLPTR